MVDTEQLRAVGIEAGLTAVGFTHAEPFSEARVTIERHKEQGLHAGMQFTYRNPERSTTPTRILDTAQSLIVGAMPYAAPAQHLPRASVGTQQYQESAGMSHRTPRPEARLPAGNQHATGLTSDARPHAEIAAYAWRDHYGTLKGALEVIAAALRSDGWTARVVADDNALVDRAAAVRAGIGWAGKNSNVLIPGHGSWFVLGAVVTDAPLEPDHPIEPSCGSCRRCLDGCPTGAIIADGVVDARRCLAWLLQADGDFPIEFREALGTRIYGCDDCQVVCPPSRNHHVELQGDEIASLDLIELLELDDEPLLELVGRWYIPKRDLRYVRRNALVAIGNAHLDASIRTEVEALLRRYLQPNEPLDRPTPGDAPNEAASPFTAADGDSEAGAGAHDAGSGAGSAMAANAGKTRKASTFGGDDGMLARHAAWAMSQQGFSVEQ